MWQTIRRGTFFFVLLGIISGCSATGRYEAECKAALKALNKLYFSYKKVEKKEEFSGFKSDISKAAAEALDVKERIDAAEPADTELKEEVLKKYSPLLEAILLRIKTEQDRIKSLAGQVEANTVEAINEYEKLTRPEESKEGQE